MRNEIKKFISLYLRQRFVTEEAPEDECDAEAEFILRYLHSKGVVVKVGGKLPKISLLRRIGMPLKMPSSRAYKLGQRDMLKVGYTKIEPLIEEE